MKIFFTLLIWVWGFVVQAQNFEIYVSDAGNFNSPPWQILKFDQNGQSPATFINTNLNWPQDILFLEDSGQVLISNLGSGIIKKFNAATGAYVSDFATGISGPTRMKIGLDGFLYVLQWNGNGKVRRYQMDGTYLGEFTSVGVPQSIGLDWDTNGNLYVSSYSGHLVRKFDPNGNDLGIFVNSNLLGPTNIWFDSNGDLLVSDYNGTSVNRYDSQGNYLGAFMTGLSQCEGVAYMPGGNILIGNGATHSVKMFDGNGTYLQDLVPPGSGNLINPNAIVIRIITGTQLPEAGTSPSAILYPVMGNEFHITQSLIQHINEIDLYSINGLLVKSFPVTGSMQSLHLDDISDGNYIVKARMNNGSVVVQQVVKLSNLR